MGRNFKAFMKLWDLMVRVFPVPVDKNGNATEDAPRSATFVRGTVAPESEPESPPPGDPGIIVSNGQEYVADDPRSDKFARRLRRPP